jgi:hypothetical protein
MCPLAAECESECEEVRCLNMNMNVNFRFASGGECRRLKGEEEVSQLPHCFEGTSPKGVCPDFPVSTTSESVQYSGSASI